MYEIGQHVIHPGQGVCTVCGYEENPSPMIVLTARCGNTDTKMLYPVSLEDRLHPCIDADQAKALLDNYAAIECDPYHERNASLEETYFKRQLKQGAPVTVQVAKTMRQRIQDAEDHDKKPSSYYARILKEAHRRVVEEFAVALDMSEDECERELSQAVLANGCALN